MISAMSSFLTLKNLVLALFKCHSYKSWELNLSTDLPVLMFLKSRRLNSDESCWRTSLYIESGERLSGKTIILIKQYLVWRHFIFRILPSKTKMPIKWSVLKKCNLLAVDYFWELHSSNRHFNVCDPGALPDAEIQRWKRMPVLEGPSLGVAFQNSLVCPLVNLHQPILVFLLVEIIDQPWGILKSKVCSTFFFFFSFWRS